MSIILFFALPFTTGISENLSYYLNSLITGPVMGYCMVLALKKTSNYPLSIPIQIILTLLAFCFYLTSSVGQLIYIILGIIITYFWVMKRSVPFNIISSLFIFATIYYSILNSIIYRILQFFIFNRFNLSTVVQAVIFVGVIQSILTILLLILVLRKLRPLILNYCQLVPIQWPIFSWVINLLACYFAIFRTSVSSNIISVPYSIYLLILAAYTVGYPLVMYLSTKSLQKNITIQNQQLELNHLSQYTSHIEAMYDELRRFRHDYKNILLSLSDAVENKNIDQVSDIFKRVVIPTNVNVETQTSVLGKLSDVKDLEVKSLIYSKTIEAIDKGIKVEIEIEKPIKLDSNIQITDMLRIISILFDNAINATLNAKQPQINLSMFEEKNVQIFQIGNSTKEEHINLSKLSGRFNGVLTNSHHGLGLRNLRSILARYPFIQNNRSSKDYWFEQQIVIYKVKHIKK